MQGLAVDLDGDLRPPSSEMSVAGEEIGGEIYRYMSERVQQRREERREMRRKEYPPPIPLLARTEKLAAHMPWVLRRYHTGDGRLVLREEKVRHHEYLRAHRAQGRLTLHLVAMDDDDVVIVPPPEDNRIIEDGDEDDEKCCDDDEEEETIGDAGGCDDGDGNGRIEEEGRDNNWDVDLGIGKCCKGIFGMSILSPIRPLHS